MDTILTILILEKHLDIIYQLWYNPFKYYISKMPEQSVLRLSDAYESKSEAEVLRVSIFEYDEEEHMRQERKALKRAKNVVKCE